MSLNRNTKAYQLRVKALARGFRYPSLVGVHGVDDAAEVIKRVVASKEPDAPSYLIEDALRFIVHEQTDSIRWAEERILEERLDVEKWTRALDAMKRPRLRLVGGDAA